MKRLSEFDYHEKTKLPKTVRDKSGNTIVYTYVSLSGFPGSYFLETVTEPDGTRIRHEYNAGTGRLEKIYIPTRSDSRDYFTQYDYTVFGAIARIRHPALAGDKENSKSLFSGTN